MRKKENSVEGREPLVSLSHCSIVLDGKTALDDISFEFNDGERWVLFGSNGSGKTLFLKLLRGDLWPTPDVTGRERREYRMDGEVGDQPAGFKERIAYVGPERQDRYVRYGWNHTVEQIVTTGLFDEEIPRTQANARQRRHVARLLSQFKIRSLRKRGFLTLSYGQRRRTLVARAFASDPKLLLLDEVFNGLDAVSSSVLHRVLSKSRGVGSTWIVSTHRTNDVPESATRFARMEAGRLSEVDSPTSNKGTHKAKRSEIKSNPTLAVSRKVSRSRATEALVELKRVDLYRDYRLVLKSIDWTIRRGEHWAIFGANGSGKSSLLKLLYGDLHPRLGGTIERAGVPFGTPIIEWKRRVGFVSPELQADYFLARDLEEVVMSGRYASVGLNEHPTRADRIAGARWLKYFGISEIAHRGPRTVSYGQMRRALLARAMIDNPELLLLDEPCKGLDPDTRIEVLRLLERLARRGVQLVMAVHDRHDVPQSVARALTINRNKSIETIELS